MTSTDRSYKRMIGLKASCLALLVCILPAAVAGENLPTLSKKELKVLLATAKTSADEQKLAAYYRDKAQRLTAKSEEFAKQADFLATQPATVESKQGISCNCTSHYRYFSKLYAEEAKDSQILAAQHDQLAQQNLSKERAQK
jgi:hypothetical protein